MIQSAVRYTFDRFRRGEIDRRDFICLATTAGLTPAAAMTLSSHVVAQDASPAASPMATPAGETIRSITREEFYAQLKEQFPLDGPEQTGGSLVHTYTTDITTLNPILVSDVFSGLIVGFVFEGLVGTSPIDGSIVPSGFADSWEIAPDGVTYTFHLNPNATWQDGQPVTAEDCVFTFDGVLADDSPSFRKGTVQLVVESYRAIDDHTFELVSLEQSAVFLENSAGQFAILAKHIWQDVPVGEWGSDTGSNGQDPSRVIGSGPFRFVEWQLGSQVRLQRNEEYWDQENVPYIDEYIFNVVADESSVIASLQTGGTDVAGIGSTQIDSLMESFPDLQVEVVDTGSFTYYMVNQDPADTELFTDVRVRQALHYALDRDTFAETVFNGYAIRADGTQPVLSPAYAPDQINTLYTYDAEKARELLDEAGWVVGGDGIREKDGARFSFECLYPEGGGAFDQGIPFMQQYWRDVGVEMLPAAIPFPTLLDRIDTFQFEMAVLGFSWGFDGLQGVMFRCDMVPFAGFNNMKYCNERYDELDSMAQRELDAHRRRELMIEAANIVNDETAIGVLVFANAIYGAAPHVRNFYPQGYSGYWWVQYAWLDR
jgi:peptide/nickel transport system substrate-binding protein